jgi:hypothetical protein
MITNKFAAGPPRRAVLFNCDVFSILLDSSEKIQRTDALLNLKGIFNIKRYTLLLRLYSLSVDTFLIGSLGLI